MVRYEHCNELMHHGIKGQQWGKRNGPPYPLSEGKHRAVIKKHKVKKTKTTGLFKSYEKVISNSFENATAPVEKRITPDGKAVYPPIAAVIEQAQRSGKDNPYDRGKKGFDGTEDEVNPDYGAPGTTNNCAFCAAAIEMRSRGYDVCARRSYGGVGAGMFERWFKGARNEYCESFNEMKSDIEKDGDGASGVMQGFYGRGLGSGDGGHSLHWENNKGEITIRDGQTHKKYSWDEAMDHFRFNDEKGCIRTRLDNHEANLTTMASDGTLGLDPNKYKGARYKDEIRIDDTQTMSFKSQDEMTKKYLKSKDNRWIFGYRNVGPVDGWYR